METMTNRLRCYMMLLLVMASVLAGVCQVPKTGFSAHATSLNFYFNDDPSVYAYTGQTRAVSATVQISIVVDGTFIPGVHTHPSWTVSISGPDPNNPQQTTTVGSATFTHPGPYTNANVSVTLPAAAGAYTYTASLTGGEGTATPASDSATIVKVNSLVPSEGTEFDDGDGNADTKSYVVPIAASGSVTVTATPYASVAENQLPSGWTFTGGTAVGLGKFQRTVSKTTAGTTTFTCTCGSSSKTVCIYVVKVASLVPDGGTEIDDGDGNADTKSYVVPIAASGIVTVTATPDAAVPEDKMPACWSYTGGTAVGLGKFQRTVSKTTAGLTTFICTCGSSSKTVRFFVYQVTYTTMPTLCAGGKNDANHKKTVIARALAGEYGIPNISIEFAFASPVSSLSAPYVPSFESSSATTDADGFATTMLKSGTAVLPSPPGKTLSTAEAVIKLNGNIVPDSNKPLAIEEPEMNVEAYYTGTFLPVDDLYLFGDGVDLYGGISFSGANITNHAATWKFRFFDHDPGDDPLSDENFLFDGSGDSPEDEDYPGYTLYGSIVDESNANGYYAYYETGTQPGWIYWYIDDTDVQKEQ